MHNSRSLSAWHIKWRLYQIKPSGEGGEETWTSNMGHSNAGSNLTKLHLLSFPHHFWWTPRAEYSTNAGWDKLRQKECVCELWCRLLEQLLLHLLSPFSSLLQYTRESHGRSSSPPHYDGGEAAQEHPTMVLWPKGAPLPTPPAISPRQHSNPSRSIWCTLCRKLIQLRQIQGDILISTTHYAFTPCKLLRHYSITDSIIRQYYPNLVKNSNAHPKKRPVRGTHTNINI